MSDPDELERIRREKMAEIAEGTTETTGEAGGADGGGAPDEPVHVEGDGHLAELVEAHDVVLADFYADWCGPCKMLEPIVADVAAESGAVVAKVDVDAHQGLAAEYGVRGVPTMVLFAGGDPVEQLVGVREKDDLLRLVERYGE